MEPNNSSRLPSRRDMLGDSVAGMAGIALACLLGREARADEKEVPSALPHFPPKAKRVIQIFAAGGVSHVDTFDHKPELEKLHGKEMLGKGKIDPFFGKPGVLMKSNWDFKQHGQSGLWFSSLLPKLAERADDLCMIHSMYSKSSNHTPATFLANTGFTLNGFPCLGSWVSYGLGSMNQDLPTFVVLPDSRGLPAGGALNWTNGFLPAAHQGAAFRNAGEPVADLSVPAGVVPAARMESLAVLEKLNREHMAANPGDSMLAARIRSYELAAKMQLSIPEAAAIDSESDATKTLYGLDQPTCAGFARNCLMARRLLERGVRFVQLHFGGIFSSPRINWDGHENIVDNHTKQAAIMDWPLAGLLADLKARGMLDDTLVVWNTEFGRTPFTEGIGGKGRDHHPLAFTTFLAGAGVKKGFAYGKSDEVGYQVAENQVTYYDFHATILHLLGIDHKRLTYYHNGLKRRLTDVHGDVIQGVLA